MVMNLKKKVLKTVNNQNVATNSLRISDDMSKNGDFVFPVFQKIQKMVIFFKKM
jgi:hypothetical protein